MKGLTSKVLAMAALMSSCGALDKTTDFDTLHPPSATELSLREEGYELPPMSLRLSAPGHMYKQVGNTVYVAHTIGDTPYVVVMPSKAQAAAQAHAKQTALILNQEYSAAQLGQADVNKDYIISRDELRQLMK